MKLFVKVFDNTTKFLAVSGAIVIMFVLIIVCLEVVMRYFFNSPIAWVVQVAEYGIFFVTFLGAAWVLRQNRHVVMDVMTNRLNQRGQAVLGIITSLIGAIVCLFFVIYGTELVVDFAQRGIYEVKEVEVPKAPLMALIPLSSLTLLIQFLRRGYGYFESWRA
ncbi:TRAP transporter small permease [Chloroflexota bacterium]